MRTNSCGVTETASIRTDQEKYSEGWDRIFSKKPVEEKKEEQKPEIDEHLKIKELARESYRNYCSQDNEGGSIDSVSYIIGFVQGYYKSLEE